MTLEELNHYRDITERVDLLRKEWNAVIRLFSFVKSPICQAEDEPIRTKLEALTSEIEDEIECLKAERADIKNVLALFEGQDFVLMFCRYVLGYRWEEVAVKLNMSYNDVLTSHAECLAKIANWDKETAAAFLI